MNGVMIVPPHGIIFVLDPENKDALIPEYVDSVVANCTDTCVSVATQAPVDGETEIFMASEVIPPSDLLQVAQCEILVPNGQIALITSDLERIFHLRLPVGRARVTVWVDVIDGPAKVVVEAKAA